MHPSTSKHTRVWQCMSTLTYGPWDCHCLPLAQDLAVWEKMPWPLHGLDWAPFPAGTQYKYQNQTLPESIPITPPAMKHTPQHTHDHLSMAVMIISVNASTQTGACARQQRLTPHSWHASCALVTRMHFA
eukprot:1158758-Pelagomonas_calceolata.AAC.6